MKKALFLLLLLPLFSFKKTLSENDIFYGDSITFGNELGPNQYTERWTKKYTTSINTNEWNLANSGATMTPGLNSGRPVFDINTVNPYGSSDRHIFISYWVNDYLYGGTPAAYAAATTTAVNAIIAKGWPASRIVLCFNYLPESQGTWVNLSDSVARLWLSALRGVQQAKGTSFLDFYTPIFNRPDKASYAGDLIHPTAAWNTVMKELALTNIEGPSTPLPATLLGFSGQRQGNTNTIKWTVAQEYNVQRYEIERSEDGTNWVNAGVVNSLGNTTIQRVYSFVDNNVSGPRQLYRLRTVDKNGVSKISNVVIIKGAKVGLLTLSGLFPNPAAGRLNLLVDAPAKDNISIYVTDAIGRVVKTQKEMVETGTNTVDVNISAIVSGTYFIKVVSEKNNTSVIRKFVKE